MSVITAEEPSFDQIDEDLDFCIIIDAPHLTIVFADGRFRGRCAPHPIALEVLREVACGHNLLIDEIAYSGEGGFEITFRESGA